MTSSATENLYCDDNDERVLSFLNRYDKDKKGFINLEEFLQFYLNCSTESNLKLHTVRNNLDSFGYNKNLELKNAMKN